MTEHLSHPAVEVHRELRSTPGVARVTALLRTDRPVDHAARATQRLVDVVAEWGEGSGLEITVRRRARSTDLVAEPRGGVPVTWRVDLAWAFDGLAMLATTRTNRPARLPTSLLEVRPARTHRAIHLSDEDLHPREWSAADELRRREARRTEVPWPVPRPVELAGLLEAAGPGLVLRYRLAAAGRLERDMLMESLVATWSDARGDLHDYLGEPVRCRVLLGNEAGVVPARARAVLRQWASFLELVQVDADLLASAWTGAPLDLAGYVVPRGAALGLVRLPASGADHTFPGIPTREPAIPPVPLDPIPPRPVCPVRLGRARSASGRWVDATVDLADLTEHCFVQGSSGTGKSTLLASICTGVQRAGGSYTLLDPDGATVDAVLRQTPQADAERLRVVRHGDPLLGVPVNVFAAPVDELETMVDMFAEMVQRSQDPNHQGMVGPRWRRWFTLISLGARQLLGERSNLVAVAAIASDMDRVRALARAIASDAPELSHRLTSEYGRLGATEAADLISWGSPSSVRSSSPRRPAGSSVPARTASTSVRRSPVERAWPSTSARTVWGRRQPGPSARCTCCSTWHSSAAGPGATYRT